MALRIRLRQQGQKNRRCYRVVVTDARTPRDGKYNECLGYYHPRDEDPTRGVKLDKERIEYWVGKGAIPSETVCKLVKKHCPEVKL